MTGTSQTREVPGRAILSEVRDTYRDRTPENASESDAEAVKRGMQEQAEKFRREGSALYQEV